MPFLKRGKNPKFFPFWGKGFPRAGFGGGNGFGPGGALKGPPGEILKKKTRGGKKGGFWGF